MKESSMNEGQKSPLRLTRRRVLQAAGAVVAGKALETVVSGFPHRPAPPKPSDHPDEAYGVAVAMPEADVVGSIPEETAEEKALREEIENEFGILLKVPPLFDKDGNQLPFTGELPWSVSQLAMLQGFLKQYPKHFLQPDSETGDKLVITQEGFYGKKCDVLLWGNEIIYE